MIALDEVLLRKECNILRQQLEQTQKQLVLCEEEHRLELSKVNRELDATRDELVVVEKQLSELQGIHNDCKQRELELVNEAEYLRSRLDSAQSEKDGLHNDIAALASTKPQRNIEAIKDQQIQGYREQIYDLQRDRLTLHRDIAGLREQLEIASAGRNDSEYLMQTAELIIRKDEELSALHATLKMMQDQAFHAVLMADVHACQNCEHLQARLDLLGRERDILQQQVDDALAEAAALSFELINAQQQLQTESSDDTHVTRCDAQCSTDYVSTATTGTMTDETCDKVTPLIAESHTGECEKCEKMQRTLQAVLTERDQQQQQYEALAEAAALSFELRTSQTAPVSEEDVVQSMQQELDATRNLLRERDAQLAMLQAEQTEIAKLYSQYMELQRCVQQQSQLIEQLEQSQTMPEAQLQGDELADQSLPLYSHDPSDKLEELSRELLLERQQYEQLADRLVAEQGKSAALADALRTLMGRHAVEYNLLKISVADHVTAAVVVERQQTDALIKELAKSREIIDDKDRLVKQKDASLLELQAELHELHAETVAMLSVVPEQVATLSHELESLRKENNNKSQQLSKITDRNVQLQERCRYLESRLTEQPRTTDSALQARVQLLMDQLHAKEEQIASLNLKLSSLSESKYEKPTDKQECAPLSPADLLVLGLHHCYYRTHSEEQRSATGHSFVTSSTRNASRAPAKDHQETHTALKQKLADMTQHNHKLNAELKATQHELDQLSSEFSRVMSEMVQIRGQIAVFEDTISSLDPTMGSVSTSQCEGEPLHHLQQLVQEERRMRLEAQEHLEEIRSTAEMTATENELLRADMDGLRAEMQSLESLMTLIKSESVRIKAENVTARKVLQDKETALENTDAALQELRSQLRSQGSDEKRIRELEGALMALQMATDKIGGDMVKLQETLTLRDQQIVAQQHHIMQLENQHHVHDTDSKGWRGHARQMQKQLRRAQRRAENSQMYAEELHQRLHEAIHRPLHTYDGFVVLDRAVVVRLHNSERQLRTVQSQLQDTLQTLDALQTEHAGCVSQRLVDAE